MPTSRIYSTSDGDKIITAKSWFIRNSQKNIIYRTHNLVRIKLKIEKKAIMRQPNKSVLYMDFSKTTLFELYLFTFLLFARRGI